MSAAQVAAVAVASLAWLAFECGGDPGAMADALEGLSGDVPTLAVLGWTALASRCTASSSSSCGRRLTTR